MGMVRRRAAMAGKPPRSSSPPHLAKDLTDALQVRIFSGNAGLCQHGAWGAASAPDSGAGTGPLESGSGRGQRASAPYTSS
jgi:hypothetical protein